MAHTCSECGEVCYCSGDIDDTVSGYCVIHCRTSDDEAIEADPWAGEVEW
jgi:hypothetical protein